MDVHVRVYYSWPGATITYTVQVCICTDTGIISAKRCMLYVCIYTCNYTLPCSYKYCLPHTLIHVHVLYVLLVIAVHREFFFLSLCVSFSRSVFFLQVNIVPVIAKADTFTPEECSRFKKLVWQVATCTCTVQLQQVIFAFGSYMYIYMSYGFSGLPGVTRNCW